MGGITKWTGGAFEVFLIFHIRLLIMKWGAAGRLKCVWWQTAHPCSSLWWPRLPDCAIQPPLCPHNHIISHENQKPFRYNWFAHSDLHIWGTIGCKTLLLICCPFWGCFTYDLLSWHLIYLLPDFTFLFCKKSNLRPGCDEETQACALMAIRVCLLSMCADRSPDIEISEEDEGHDDFSSNEELSDSEPIPGEEDQTRGRKFLRRPMRPAFSAGVSDLRNLLSTPHPWWWLPLPWCRRETQVQCRHRNAINHTELKKKNWSHEEIISFIVYESNILYFVEIIVLEFVWKMEFQCLYFFTSLCVICYWFKPKLHAEMNLQAMN